MMNRFTKRAICLSLMSFGICLLISCAAWNHKKEMEPVIPNFDPKPLEDKVFEQDRKIKDSADVVYLLELGQIYSAKGEFEKSNIVLEEAYKRYTSREEEAILGARKLGSETVDVMLGEGSRSYELADYEKVYLHAIKAMNYLMLGDVDSARVETMRGIERHLKIREFREFEIAQVEQGTQKLESLIAEHKQATGQSKEQRGKEDFDLKKSLEEATQKADLPFQLEKEIMAVRNSYENSYTYLLSAINFGLIGGEDCNNIPPELRKAETISENQCVKALLTDCNKNNNCMAEGRNVYIFAQVGMAPEKENLTIPFPNPFSKTVCQFSMSRIKPVSTRIGSIEASSSRSKTAFRLEQLTNVELLPLKEYKERLPRNITKAVLRVIVQSLLDSGVMKKTDKNNMSSQLATQSLLSLVNIITSNADTRTWLTAPKSIWFYCGRLDGTELIFSVRDKTGNLMDSQTVSINPDKLNLVNLRCLDNRTFVQSKILDLPKGSSIQRTDSSLTTGLIDVTEAQRLLNQKGYNAGKPDGVIGPRTRQAISRFQKDHGLPVSGKLTQETMSKLLE